MPLQVSPGWQSEALTQAPPVNDRSHSPGVVMPQELVQQSVLRVQGWPAAVQLAGLAMHIAKPEELKHPKGAQQSASELHGSPQVVEHVPAGAQTLDTHFDVATQQSWSLTQATPSAEHAHAL